MNPFYSLYRSIIPNPDENPERLNATLERIQEVTKLVLRDQAPNLSLLLIQANMPVQSPRDPINCNQAHIISRSLTEKADLYQTQQMITLLENAEMSAAEAIELHESYKIPVSRLETDIIPVNGEGAWITDINGKRYLDMDSNYGATNLGMSNIEIAKALFNQASKLISVKEDRVHIARARFLKAFKSMLPKELCHFYWQNSGGEAVDKCLKIAKAYTGETGVVAFKGGFHGRTHGAVSVTYNIQYRKPFGLDNVDWVHFAEFNDPEAVETFFAEGKAKIVILELIQGEEAGIRPARPEFVKKLCQICNHYNGVMICDEVQTGFGRVAEEEGQWFACQQYGIVPDIMAIGKSFGGGYPVTAVVTKEQISRAMQPGYDGSTFGGNPMAMAAATVATRQMQRIRLTRNVVYRSAQIKRGLQNLKEKFPIIRDIRIKGLFIGFDLPSLDHVAHFQKVMAEYGVKSSLSTGFTVRFLPPLIITKQEVNVLLDVMDKALKMLSERNARYIPMKDGGEKGFS